MPLSTTTLVRFAAKLSRYLSLALLPALASEALAVGQPQRKQNVRSAQPDVTPKARALPYLAALGPIPLRFARPGLEPTDEPPASPEPKPASAAEMPATKNDQPSAPVEGKPDALTTPSDSSPLQPDQHRAPLSEFSEPDPQPALPILPDDTKRELRAEDVLPFFIYPTNSPGDNGVRLIAPLRINQSQSDPIPPSSATYQQK